MGTVGDGTESIFWGRRLFPGLTLLTGIAMVLMATPGISTGDRLFAVLGTWMMSSVVGVAILCVWAVKLRLNDATAAATATLPLGPKRLLGGTFALGVAAYVVGIAVIAISGQSYDWTVVNVLAASVFFVAGIAGPVATLVQTYQLNAHFSPTQ